MYHGTQRKIVNADYVKRRLTHVNKPFLLGYEHKGIYTELEKRFSTNDELMKEVEHLQSQGYIVYFKQHEEVKNTRRTTRTSK